MVIPLNAPDKYRWWAGGQSIFDTLLQLNASDTLIEQHIGPITTPDAWRRWMKIKKDRDQAPPSDDQDLSQYDAESGGYF